MLGAIRILRPGRLLQGTSAIVAAGLALAGANSAAADGAGGLVIVDTASQRIRVLTGAAPPGVPASR